MKPGSVVGKNKQTAKTKSKGKYFKVFFNSKKDLTQEDGQKIVCLTVEHLKLDFRIKILKGSQKFKQKPKSESKLNWNRKFKQEFFGSQKCTWNLFGIVNRA